MDTRPLYPHLTFDEAGTARLARFPRIRVAQIVMDHLAHGWSVEEMCRQHPDLTPAEVHAAMLYYWDHQEDLHQEIEAEWKQAETEAARDLPLALALRFQHSSTAAVQRMEA